MKFKTPEKCCSDSHWKDLSQGIGDNRNWYCPKCESHFYKNKLWDKKEWKEWIDSSVLDMPPACRRCVNSESTGVHYDGFWCGVGRPSGERTLVLGNYSCLAYKAIIS